MSPTPLTPAQLSNFLPLTAWGYSWWRARSLSLLSGEDFGLAREARLFLTLCRPEAGERWLDAGTSTGFYAGVLAGQGCEVTAADLSPAMLREGQRQAGTGGGHARIDWVQADLERTGWPAAQFDGVTVGATLNETAQPAVFLRELQRLLRPSGQLWLMWVPESGGWGQRTLGRWGGLSFPSLSAVERELSACTLQAAQQVGGVQFARFVKSGE